MRARTTTTATFTPAERARLRALCDAVPRPLPELNPLDHITEPPELVAALDYFHTLWRTAWEARKYGGATALPELPAYHAHTVWLAMRSADETLSALYALTEDA